MATAPPPPQPVPSVGRPAMCLFRDADGNATVCRKYMMQSFCVELSPQLLTADPGVDVHNNPSVGGHWLSSLASD